MPYRLFGYDASGRPMKPIFSNANSEDEAVASANERGMLVQEIRDANGETDHSGYVFVDQAASSSPSDARVVVAGISIPFWDLVWFLVKLSIAAIPATIIITIVYAVFVGVIAGLFSGFR